jgi:cytochrome c oxidase assembly protein subunit 15
MTDSENTIQYNQSHHRLALGLMLLTFILIFAGALVTSTGSSLSVPDWPLSYGTLFPSMKGGVLFEHSHRLLAGIVLIYSLILAIYTQRIEKRQWVKRLVWITFGAVILQAILGGLTVLFLLPEALSVAHAGLAQIFVCLVASIWVATSKEFINSNQHIVSKGRFFFPYAAVATVCIIYIQILLGALTRHSGAGLAIPDYPLSFGHLIPPYFDHAILVDFLHRTWAWAVLFSVLYLVAVITYQYPEEKWLFRPAILSGFLVLLQMALGIMVVIGRKQIVPTSLHVVNGALVLVTVWVLSFRSFRIFKKSSTTNDN